MNQDELKELFAQLEAQGWEPMLCDTRVPMYETRVPCGVPVQLDDASYESVWLPKELLSMHPEFMIPVRGDSMRDAGIVTGDVVKVVGDTMPQDGDIVLACIDGEYTLKAFCETDDGQLWLVPQNDSYDPICLNGCTNVRIVGCVREVVKRAPRVSHRKSMRAISRKREAELRGREVSAARVSAALRAVAPMVDTARQWYAVYRVLVDLNVVEVEDYDTFIGMVRSEVPEHVKQPSRTELQRMAVDSFSRPVAQWNAGNAPVQGKRFREYLSIAQRVQQLLDE